MKKKNFEKETKLIGSKSEEKTNSSIWKKKKKNLWRRRTKKKNWENNENRNWEQEKKNCVIWKKLRVWDLKTVCDLKKKKKNSEREDTTTKKIQKTQREWNNQENRNRR